MPKVYKCDMPKTVCSKVDVDMSRTVRLDRASTAMIRRVDRRFVRWRMRMVMVAPIRLLALGLGIFKRLALCLFPDMTVVLLLRE